MKRKGSGPSVPEPQAPASPAAPEEQATPDAAPVAPAEGTASPAPDLPVAPREGAGAEPLPWLQRIEEDGPKPRRLSPVAGVVVALVALLLGAGVVAYVASLNARDHGSSSASPERLPEVAAALGDALPKASGTGGAQTGTRPPLTAASHAGRHTSEQARSVRRASAQRAPAKSPAKAAAAQASRQARAKEGTRPHTASRQAPQARAAAAFASGRPILQIGAFASRTAAERAWETSSRRGPLQGGAHRIERASVHGHVVFRLRAQLRRGGCERLGRGSSTCFQVGR